tara:strand:+ start:820 stop:1287 length:468 start_codon:yes stop_codon:yes gene_type:complete
MNNKNTRFWISPLIVGSLLSLSYGITKRTLIRQKVSSDSIENLFQTQIFPGISVKSLQSNSGATFHLNNKSSSLKPKETGSIRLSNPNKDEIISKKIYPELEQIKERLDALNKDIKFDLYKIPKTIYNRKYRTNQDTIFIPGTFKTLFKELSNNS